MSKLHFIHQSPKTWPLSHQYLTALLIILLSRAMRLPGPLDMYMDMLWFGALLSGIIFRIDAALFGVGLSEIIFVALGIHRVSPDVYGFKGILFSALFSVGVLSGLGWLRWRYEDPPKPFARLFILLSIPLAINLVLTFNLPNPHPFRWIYFAAGIITIILTISKMRLLEPYFSRVYTAWLIGYGFFCVLLWFSDWDVNAAGFLSVFLQRHVLMTFPVYNLELLLVAHIVLAFSHQQAGRTMDQ